MPKDWSKYNKWKKSQKEHKHSETPNHKRISAEAPNSALINNKFFIISIFVINYFISYVPVQFARRKKLKIKFFG